MLIDYRIGTEKIEWDALFQLYRDVGLVGGLAKNGETDKVRAAFEHSQKIVTAWFNGRMIGAGRLISDGVCYGTLFDVGVLPEYQKKGVGKGIMTKLLEGNDHLQVYTTSAFGSEDFFKKLGFKRHKSAYAKYPRESEYLE